MIDFIAFLSQKILHQVNYPVHAAVAITKGVDKIGLDGNYYMYPQKHLTRKTQLSMLDEQWVHSQLSDYLPKGFGFFAICDGVSAYRGSEYATYMLATGLQERMQESLEDTTYRKEDLQIAIEQLNKEIFNYAKENPSVLHMSSTLAGLWVTPESIHTVNVGNSRIYRFLDNQLSLLTTPQNKGEFGMPYSTLMDNLPKENPMYSYMGIHEDEGVLRIDFTEIENLCEKEWFLLASDALMQLFELREIEKYLSIYYEEDQILIAVKTLTEKVMEKAKIQNLKTDDLICMIVCVGQE